MKKTNDKQQKIMSSHIGADISPRKVMPVANTIRGKNLQESLNYLEFSPLKASSLMIKIVKSAYGNMKNLKPETKDEEIYIKDINVGPGKMRKWGRPGGKGSVKPIKNRSTHISVFLDVMSAAPKEVKASKEEIKK